MPRSDGTAADCLVISEFRFWSVVLPLKLRLTWRQGKASAGDVPLPFASVLESCCMAPGR